jgi:uncharacterized protein
MDAPRLQFPCDYPVKVVMRTGAEVRAAVDAAIVRHAGAESVAGALVRASAQGNFSGVTYTFVARDAPHIAAVFAAVKEIEGVLLVI